MKRPIRVAARAVLLHRDRLLLVNAFAGHRSDLWCAPGGGAEPHASLPDNLIREVREECGLEVRVGAPCLVNEFHDPVHGFHQVEVFFRCRLHSGVLSDTWTDPEGVVNRRRWVSRAEMGRIRFKPDALAAVAWQDKDAPPYDPLERLTS
jgi:8-oxo-dGTP diphosphatase